MMDSQTARHSAQAADQQIFNHTNYTLTTQTRLSFPTRSPSSTSSPRYPTLTISSATMMTDAAQAKTQHSSTSAPASCSRTVKRLHAARGQCWKMTSTWSLTSVWSLASKPYGLRHCLKEEA